IIRRCSLHSHVFREIGISDPMLCILRGKLADVHGKNGMFEPHPPHREAKDERRKSLIMPELYDIGDAAPLDQPDKQVQGRNVRLASALSSISLSIPLIHDLPFFISQKPI